jgi:branched-chain amino acid transport system substrate-binding protein
VLLAATTVLALTAGCGTWVEEDRIDAQGNGYGPAAAARSATAPAASQAVAAPAAPGTSGAGAVDRTNIVNVPTSAGSAPQSTTTVKSGAGPTSGTNAARGDQVGSTAQPAAAAPARATVTGDAPAPCTKQLSPIVIGQTGAFSGLVGASIGGIRNGLAGWARDVNARGGVQCHPIELLQLDDGSDPARVAANYNTIVKQRGAVAIVGPGVPLAIAPLRSAAERDKVPVVGGDLTAVDWAQSPFLFPSGGAPLTAYDGAIIEAAKAAGGGKLGMIYCVEGAICTDIKNNAPTSAQRAGFALGPVKAVSLTQPDFTAECQLMKDAGVSVFFLALDGSAMVRVARNCASLGYRPKIAAGAIAVSAAVSDDKNLQQDNMFLGTPIAPYLTAESTGARDFRTAMQRYAPSVALDQQTMLGWAAGKLFEAALAKVADKARGGNVTTEMVLDGLWQLKNEKLAGLSPGATFTRGEPAKPRDCYYALRLAAGGFSAPNGDKLTCPGEKSPARGAQGSDLPMAVAAMTPSGRAALGRRSRGGSPPL